MIDQSQSSAPSSHTQRKTEVRFTVHGGGKTLGVPFTGRPITSSSKSHSVDNIKEGQSPQAVLKTESQEQKFCTLLRNFESKGLKSEHKFTDYVQKLSNYQGKSQILLSQNKKRAKSLQSSSNTRSSDVQKPQSYTGFHSKINPEQSETATAANALAHSTHPQVFSGSSKKKFGNQFSFTNKAHQVVLERRFNRMKDTCNRIRYEINHPENIVKYFTNNPVFYENIVQRKVRAIVRKLPFMKIEAHKNARDIIEAETKKAFKISIPREMTNLRGETAKFTEDFRYEFDRVFDEHASNHVIYSDSIQRVVRAVIHEKTRALVASYGTGGTGKTYSLTGDPGNEIHRAVLGISAHAAKDIIEEVKKAGDVCAFVSCYEIYQRKIYDLLDERSIIAVEDTKDNAVLVGITRTEFKSLEGFAKIIEKGHDCWKRSLKPPNANGRKSFLVTEITFSGNFSSGSLVFLDMAADEPPLREELWDKAARMAISDLKQTFVAFKECARSIETTKKLPPFRSSELTAALKPYFLGNCFILLIGHINPILECEQNIFRTLNYCTKICKPPGEVLNLQEAKTRMIEMKIVEDVAVATKIDYNKMLTDPKELLINNSEDDPTTDIKSSPFNERLRSLLNSHQKNRPKASSINFSTPSKLFITGDSYLFPKSPQKPAAQIRINTENLEEKAKPPQKKPFKKHKKGQKLLRATIEMRATKTKQNLDELLVFSEPEESVNSSSPVPRINSSAIRRSGSPVTHDTQAQQNSYCLNRSRIPSQLTLKERIEVEDDLELQEDIKIDNKIHERKEKLLVSKDRDKHYRSSQERFDQREKFTRLINPLLSPEKADRDALHFKLQYYHMASKSLNPELTTKNKAHYRYKSNKRQVHELCIRISGQCDDVKVRNKGMEQSLTTEIESITTNFSKIRDTFQTHEEEIVNQLKQDYYEEKSLQNHKSLSVTKS